MVAAALHGRGQLVGPAEGADEQRHQNRHQGLCLLHQIAAFKIRTPGLLGGHDLVRLLNEGGDEPQGDGHHHSQLVHRHMEAFEPAHELLQRIRQPDRAGGIGQKERAHNEQHDADDHEHRVAQARV